MAFGPVRVEKDRVGSTNRQIRETGTSIMVEGTAFLPGRKTVMARNKRTSPSLAKAKDRASALASISKTLDLGNSLTLAGYIDKTTALEVKLNDYNTTLSMLDGLANELDKMEEELDDLSERMLLGVGSKFGKNSDEYEKAGGKKKSERRRGANKTEKPATP
jgi:hypothetical protein